MWQPWASIIHPAQTLHPWPLGPASSQSSIGRGLNRPGVGRADAVLSAGPWELCGQIKLGHRCYACQLSHKGTWNREAGLSCPSPLITPEPLAGPPRPAPSAGGPVEPLCGHLPGLLCGLLGASQCGARCFLCQGSPHYACGHSLTGRCHSCQEALRAVSRPCCSSQPRDGGPLPCSIQSGRALSQEQASISTGEQKNHWTSKAAKQEPLALGQAGTMLLT